MEQWEEWRWNLRRGYFDEMENDFWGTQKKNMNEMKWHALIFIPENWWMCKQLFHHFRHTINSILIYIYTPTHTHTVRIYIVVNAFKNSCEMWKVNSGNNVNYHHSNALFFLQSQYGAQTPTPIHTCILHNIVKVHTPTHVNTTHTATKSIWLCRHSSV